MANKGTEMNRNLESKRINGMYMGLWPYTGTVLASRVKYGGTVEHLVQPDQPFMIHDEVCEVIVVEQFNRILQEGE